MDTSRYQNAIIYKICCKDSAIKDIYIGSTCAFRHRKYQHKSNCNNEKSKSYNFYVYKFIRENGGWDNFQMIELIKYPCDTKRELELKEREIFELLSATLNKQFPSRTRKEWKEVNIEETNEKSKEYYEANKEELKEKQREKFKCDCGGKFTRCSKSVHLKTKKHKKYLNSLSI